MSSGFVVANSVLVLTQAVLVVAPGRGIPRRLARLGGRGWSLVLPLSIAVVVAAIAAEPGVADGLTWLALLAIPLLAAAALGWALHGARPWLALLAVPLLVLAVADTGGLAGDASAAALTALSCVTLGRLLAGAVPGFALKAGIVAMAAIDAVLVFGQQLQGPNAVLNAAAPAAGLPQLQFLDLHHASMGYGDVFVAGVLGGLLAAEGRSQLVAAGLVLGVSVAWDGLFFTVDTVPATVPVALVVLGLEAARALRRERARPRPRTLTRRLQAKPPVACGPGSLRAVRLLATFLARLALAVGVVIVVAAIAIAIPRWARPDLYVGETGIDGVLRAMERAFLHFDFGLACGWAGCPPVRDMWARGYVADLSMLLGTVVIGVGTGFAVGLWCASRAGSRRARVVEIAATILYCGPVYVFGFWMLLLFNGSFGHIPVPYFFDAVPIWASPFTDPWDWFRTMLVPWLVAAAPLAAMCLRLVAALIREQLHTDHVRTAIAKGVPHRRVVSHHAGPFAHAATASFVGVSAPFVVLNLILVERVFAVPGFFLHTWRATGHSDSFRRPPVIDYEMLVWIAIWGSIFVVVLSLAVEFALLRLDPRIRTAQGT